MRFALRLALLLGSIVAATIPRVVAATSGDEEGFVALFNGRDLAGWKNVNCAPETWRVEDGKIVCTGKPIGALRTERQYENFIVEFEWRHLTRAGNSGMFVWATPINAPGVPFLRSIEVQALDHGYAADYEQKHGKKADWFTTHGDVFPIHGATMKTIGRTNGKRSFPTEERSKPSPEWNHYRIVANNGALRLHVNGKEVSGGDDCRYRKGYLALESEGAPVEFRALRIKELPSTKAGPDDTAPLDPGWHPLFNGLDLRGWKTNEATAARWVVIGEKMALKPVIVATDANRANDATLWTQEEFGPAEFVIDYQPSGTTDDQPPASAQIIVRGTPVRLEAAEGGKFARFVITAVSETIRVQREGGPTREFPLSSNPPARAPLGIVPGEAAGVFMNLHARAL